MGFFLGIATLAVFDSATTYCTTIDRVLLSGESERLTLSCRVVQRNSDAKSRSSVARQLA